MVFKILAIIASIWTVLFLSWKLYLFIKKYKEIYNILVYNQLYTGLRFHDTPNFSCFLYKVMFNKYDLHVLPGEDELTNKIIYKGIILINNKRLSQNELIFECALFKDLSEPMIRELISGVENTLFISHPNAILIFPIREYNILTEVLEELEYVNTGRRFRFGPINFIKVQYANHKSN